MKEMGKEKVQQRTDIEKERKRENNQIYRVYKKENKKKRYRYKLERHKENGQPFSSATTKNIKTPKNGIKRKDNNFSSFLQLKIKHFKERRGQIVTNKKSAKKTLGNPRKKNSAPKICPRKDKISRKNASLASRKISRPYAFIFLSCLSRTFIWSLTGRFT